MTFKTVAEAFEFYKDKTPAQIETRAAEIKGQIETDPAADVTTLKIEIDGLSQARANMTERQPQGGTQSQGGQPAAGSEARSSALSALNLITGTGRTEVQTFEPDTAASTPEYRSAFCKHLLGREMTTTEQKAFNAANKRADTFSTVSGAAAVIPTQMLNEVISKARTEGGSLAKCRAFNIPSGVSVPIGTPDTAAAWHTEGAAVDTKLLNPASVTFSGYELLKIFSLSVAASSMSIPAFESYITDELNSCILRAIDAGIVSGSGSSQPKGFTKITFGSGMSATYAKGGKPAYTDICNMLAALKRGYNAGASFIMNNATLYGKVYGIVDTTGRPIFIQDPKNEEIGYLLGKPVVVDDNVPDNEIYLGNLNYMGYNLPQGIMIEASRQSSFKSGLIDYRAIAVADAKPLVDEAFVKLSMAAA